MLIKFSLAFSVTCFLSLSGTMKTHAQDGRALPLTPVHDPVFSPDRATEHQIKGKLLFDALNDIEQQRKTSRQTASEARKEGSRLLAFDWELQFETDDKGKFMPKSSSYLFQPSTTPPSRDKSTKRIPKPIVILAIQIQQGQGGKFDSGQGSGHQGLTGDELDLICGPDWIVTWLEDENGNMIPGSAELYCGGESYPLPLE